MYQIACPSPRRLTRLCMAVVLLAVDPAASRVRAQQTMERSAPQERKVVEVIAAPSAEQLAIITHPELRAELLRMAEVDQAARSAAT